MKTYLFSLLIIIVVGLSLLNVWLYFQQPGMMFYPYEELVSTPEDWDLPYEDVYMTTGDNIQLHGWYIPAKEARRVVLFFHGNAGNISHRGESMALFHQLGVNVLIIDYRGYGRSQGQVSEPGMYIDAETSWQYLREHRGFASQDIIIFGRSLGAAIATQLASRVEPAGLIIESPFSSVRDMARHMMPLLSRLFYLRYEFDSLKTIAEVKAPKLIMHSPQDELIPFWMGEKLFDSAPEPKQFYSLQGGHNEGFLASQPGYSQQLATFLKNL